MAGMILGRSQAKLILGPSTPGWVQTFALRMQFQDTHKKNQDMLHLLHPKFKQHFGCTPCTFALLSSCGLFGINSDFPALALWFIVLMVVHIVFYCFYVNSGCKTNFPWGNNKYKLEPWNGRTAWCCSLLSFTVWISIFTLQMMIKDLNMTSKIWCFSCKLL